LNRRENDVRSTLGLAALLIALVIALLVMTHQTRHDLDAVKSVNLASSPAEVAASPFDQAASDRLAARLRQLLDEPNLPGDELRAAASRAASWAAGLAAGSPGYHTAVNLRAAADELLASSDSLADPHRARARSFLDRAEAAPGSPGGGPPGAVGAIRDQMQNLQQRHVEQLQETDRDQH
jgi:hypothetical protein